MNNTKNNLELAFADALTIIKPYYLTAQQKFIQYSSCCNFTVFCIVYAVILFWLLIKCTARKSWRPKNKQLKTFKELLKQKAYTFLFSIPILKQIVNGKFQQQLQKQEVKIIQELQKHWDHRRVNALPIQGMTDDNLRKRIYQWVEKEKLIWNTGRISGAFYPDSEQHMKQMNDFAAVYLYHNPLHLDTYKQLLRIQKEVLNMTGSLLTETDKEYYGTITSGGSESLMLALYAYRNYYSNRTKPNIVIPVTAHAAIDKGCFYLNIEARKAKLNDKFQVDVDHMQSLIDHNTIMILGSAPNYPHGIIDPIDKVAKLAKRKNIGCHIDACLGGFVGVFHPDFKHLYSMDRDGVTSVSIDQHKFGLAPKGISSIFYKTLQLRQSQYYVNTEWRGGLYATATFPGSRSGFASMAGWYSLTQITMKGFKENAKNVVNATIEGAAKLRNIKGITVFGEPKLCVISFTTSDPGVSPLRLGDFLSHEKKWNLSALHKPSGIHISVTLANANQVIENLAKDVEEGLHFIKSKGKIKQSVASAIYGTSTKIPTDGMEQDIIKLLLGASVK